MKEGFIVDTCFFAENDNCILVDNDFKNNEVVNVPINYKELKTYKDKTSIGVWKIKSLKN